MRRILLAAICLVFVTLVAACSSGSAAPIADDGVVISTIVPAGAAVPPPSAPVQIVEAGKSAPPTQVPGAPSLPTPTIAAPAAVATPDNRPTTGRWIDVDLTRLQVLLMDGTRVMQSIGPVAIGAQVNTGVYESTQTGLFHVYAKTRELAYDAPYNTYISHWVGFDIDKANGFHSFLKDASGAVVDPSTGRVSNGCIRTGAPEAIFDFAEPGMPVLVHL